MKILILLSVVFSMIQSGFSNTIDIKNFNLAYNNEKVDITWSCEVYDEAYLFIIEKSDGTTMFSLLDTIHSKPGNENYLYGDESLVYGLAYYKIRCIKQNGEEITSIISYIEVNPSSQGEVFKIGLYPMPFADHLNLKIECEEEISLSIRCHDLDGKLLFDILKPCNKGCNTFKFDEWIALKSDSYYLTVSDGYLNTKTTHIIKNR